MESTANTNLKWAPMIGTVGKWLENIVRKGENDYQHFLLSIMPSKAFCITVNFRLTLSQTSAGFYVSAVQVF